MTAPAIVIRLLLVGSLVIASGLAIDADELRIDTPQRATLFLANGRKLSGKLISLDSKEVRFQVTGSTDIGRYFVAQIKSVKTADDEFIYDAEASGFVSAKGTGGKPAEKVSIIASGKASPADKAIETVTVEGVGNTAKAALKDAFRKAVSKVVGILVDAETLVKDDEVISDQVLEYSGGFVSGYDTISETEENGLFRVNITARVERRQVLAKLKAAKVTVRAVDGKDLVAEVITKQEARKNATALLAKAFEDLPKCLLAEIVGKPRYDESSSSVVVEIVVRADMGQYHTALKNLTPVLNKVSLAKASFLIGGQPEPNHRSYPHWPLSTLIDRKQAAQIHGPTLGVEDRTWAAWIVTFADRQFTLARCHLYILDAEPNASLGALNGQFRVHTEFFAKDGSLVTEDEFPLTDPDDVRLRRAAPMLVGQSTYSIHSTSRAASSGFGRHKAETSESREILNLVIAPLSMDLNTSAGAFPLQRYSPTLSLQRKVKLTLDQLERVKDVKCTVELTSDSAPNSRRPPRSGGRGKSGGIPNP